MDSPQLPAKLALRKQVGNARRRRAPAEIAAASRAIAGHVTADPDVRRAGTVAAYVSIGSEPGTTLLLDDLRDGGRRVLLPVLLPDGDLTWAVYTGLDGLAPARRGLLEPSGERLSVEAIAQADVVLVPGLAVDDHGLRLGRGGGSYDRALARVPVGTPTWVLLYDDEAGLPVPREEHDRSVTAAATPSGVRRFGTDRWLSSEGRQA